MPTNTAECSARVNEAHGVSERFRAALEATAARPRGRKAAGQDPDDGGATSAGSWGSVWKALIRVHTGIMLRVRQWRAEGRMFGTLVSCGHHVITLGQSNGLS